MCDGRGGNALPCLLPRLAYARYDGRGTRGKSDRNRSGKKGGGAFKSVWRGRKFCGKPVEETSFAGDRKDGEQSGFGAEIFCSRTYARGRSSACEGRSEGNVHLHELLYFESGGVFRQGDSRADDERILRGDAP